MSKKQIYGIIDFRYGAVRLPLEIAHKVQALLAEHAVTVDSIYCRNSNPVVKILKEYEVSAVVVENKPPDFDCSELSENDYNEWRTIVVGRDPGAAIINPKDFKVLNHETDN